MWRSWSRQFSVVEVPDQSILLHSQALSSIIVAPRSENNRTYADHGAGNFPSRSHKKRKQPHLCRSWSRQFSIVEVPDQSLSLHSQALSSIIAAARSENSRTCADHGACNFPSWSPKKRKQPHMRRSWSRQFSVVEVPDQSISFHSQALSSIIAAPRSENNRTYADHGAGNFPSRSREKRKQPHLCRSWSRQFSVVEIPDQSLSLHSQALSSIIAGTFQHNCSREKRKQPHLSRSWSRQFSVVKVPDQSLSLHSQALSSIIAVVEVADPSLSLHSQALSSIIAAPRSENSRTCADHGAGNFSSWSPEKRKQPHLCRSWSRQFSVVEVPDQSISLHSQALSSIIAAPSSENSRTCADHGAAARSENSRTCADHGADNFPSWRSLTNRSRFTSRHFPANCGPEKRKQPHLRRSWSRQFSVVEVPDQSLLLHSQALSSMIAAARSENSRTCADHGAGNFPSWSPEKRKQPHLRRSWSRQFSVVEVPDQSISLHSQALSSIIAAPRSENNRTCADHGAGNFPSWSPEKRKQPHLCRSWSRQFSVVEVPDQSISLHSQALSSIIAAARSENNRTCADHGADNFPSWSPEKQKQPHMCRSWSRQFSVMEVPDQSISFHSQALSSIIAAPRSEKSCTCAYHRAGNFPLWSPEKQKQPHLCRSWSKQFSVVEVPYQSISLHSQALSSIIAAPRSENNRTCADHGAGTFQHNYSPEKQKQPHMCRSWSRQFSVMEVPDQSLSLHSHALSSMISAARSENNRTCADHGADNFPSWSPEKQKQPHMCRSWSRQFSVVEVPDQSISLHSQALSSIIAAPRSENNRTYADHGVGNFPSWSPEKRKQSHMCRSWSRQFSVVEVPDQLLSLHSQALSSIIAAARSENSRTCADHGAGNFPSWSLEKRKQPHLCRSWSRQFSVVEVPDQSISFHSQALSSIIAAPRNENNRTCADHGAGNFSSWRSLTNRSRFTLRHIPASLQPHLCRSWSRQFSVVEVPDQSLSLHSQALSSIIVGTFQHNYGPEKRKQPHMCRSWSRQFSVVEVPDQLLSLHSQALFSIIAAARSENSRTCADHGAGQIPSWRSLTNRSGFFPRHFPP
ncbi:unnamed protein product [Closterium sp. Yama58-4]|nr:unnamed protein product [Closterium sp. Yama58-4]